MTNQISLIREETSKIPNQMITTFKM